MAISKYTCIIIDDEKYAIDLLESRLQILNRNVEVIHTYTQWPDALQGLREHKCDILFVDISMQGRSGLDLVKMVPDLKSEIIFITAYSEYAINAFQLSATGYVLKPIDDTALVHAIDKAIEHIQGKRLSGARNTPALVANKIGIPHQKAIVYVDIDAIIYLEAVNTYTKVIMQVQEMLCSYNLGKYKTLLPDHTFYQVHRSYIVNLSHVVRYETAGYLIMDNKKEIPVSKNLREDFLTFFGSSIGR